MAASSFFVFFFSSASPAAFQALKTTPTEQRRLRQRDPGCTFSELIPTRAGDALWARAAGLHS